MFAFLNVLVLAASAAPTVSSKDLAVVPAEVRMEWTSLEADVTRIEGELKTARKAVAEAKAAKSDAKDGVDAAKDAKDAAKDKLDKVKDANESAVDKAKKELELAEGRLSLAEEAEKVAKGTWKLEKKSGTDARVGLLRTEYDTAKAHRKQMKSDLAKAAENFDKVKSAAKDDKKAAKAGIDEAKEKIDAERMEVDEKKAMKGVEEERVEMLEAQLAATRAELEYKKALAVANAGGGVDVGAFSDATLETKADYVEQLAEYEKAAADVK